MAASISRCRSLIQSIVAGGHDDLKEELFARVCNWFTKGFDAADLQDATALLKELSQDD